MNPAPSAADLRAKIISSGIWTLLGHGASQIIRLFGNLIATRLLFPEAFGLMAIANVIIFGLSMFSDIGLRQNIIQSHRGNERVYLDTVWTLQICRGLLLWLVAILIAAGLHLLAFSGFFEQTTVYADPQLPWIIIAMGFCAVISGFESTKVATASREMQLNRTVLIALGAQVLALAVLLGVAALYHSIWALVISAVVSSVSTTLAGHWLLHGPSNRLHWHAPTVREVIRFGKWVFLSSILGFITLSGDRLMLGALIDTRTMGLYATAHLLVSAILDVFSKLASSTAFPALSEVHRSHPAQLKQQYYKLRRFIDITTLAATGLLLTCGQTIIDLLYDHRYSDAGLMLQILSIILLEARYNISSQLFLATGKPSYLSAVIAIRAAALFVILPISYHLGGVHWALAAASLSALLSIPASLYFQHRLQVLDWRLELRYLPVLPAALVLGWLISQGMAWLLPQLH